MLPAEGGSYVIPEMRSSDKIDSVMKGPQARRYSIYMIRPKKKLQAGLGYYHVNSLRKGALRNVFERHWDNPLR